MSVEMLRVSFPVIAQAHALVGSRTREAVFLRVNDGVCAGFGECAPLAGLHHESLDEAMSALEDWSDGSREIEELPRSAAFAASCAVATMEGFGAHAVTNAAVAHLYHHGDNALDDDALFHLRDARVVKVKIGRASAASEMQLLRTLLRELPHIQLRLDGNRSLTRDECIARVHGLDAARIEYLEDPLRDPSELALLSRATGVRIALDETVLDDSTAAQTLRELLARDGCVAAWVLRMSRLGSLESVRARAAQAASMGADAVLSTAFESSYSLRVAVHLAASIPNARRAHGLGTAWVLGTDSCTPACIEHGEIAGTPLPIPFAQAWES